MARGLPWGTVGCVYFDDGYTDLAEGAETYLGIRFDLGGGNQRGWLGVVRMGPELDALAWGYEMEPEVPRGDSGHAGASGRMHFGH